MRLACAARNSVTMPGVRRLKYGSIYPFHPRCGQMVQVMFRRRFARRGSLWSWSSRTARWLWSHVGWQRQRLAPSPSPRALGYRSVGSSSCARLDGLLASSCGELDPRGGGYHALTTDPAERPVRDGSGPGRDSGGTEKALVRLVECLLVEAVAEREAAAQADGLETREAGNEQDHA